MHVLPLVLILAASQGAPAASPAQQLAQDRQGCPADGAAAAKTRFDPLTLDLSGDAQASAGIAIDEEGGPNQHPDRPRPKGTAAGAPAGGGSATAGAAAQRHAIKTEGTWACRAVCATKHE